MAILTGLMPVNWLEMNGMYKNSRLQTVPKEIKQCLKKYSLFLLRTEGNLTQAIGKQKPLVLPLVQQ